MESDTHTDKQMTTVTLVHALRVNYFTYNNIAVKEQNAVGEGSSLRVLPQIPSSQPSTSVEDAMEVSIPDLPPPNTTGNPTINRALQEVKGILWGCCTI